MTVAPRPTPLHPPITNAVDLLHHVARRIAALDADCYDDETIQSIGQLAHHRSLGAMGELRDLCNLIAAWATEEAEDREREAAQDRVDDAYKAAGFDAMDPTLARLMDGDR